MQQTDVTILEWDLRALRVAQEYIRRGWCQRSWACDAAGRWASISHPEAVSWCLSGALALGAEDMSRLPNAPCYSEIRDRLFSHVLQEIGTPPGLLVVWNDAQGRTQAEVLELLDQTAIRIQEVPS